MNKRKKQSIVFLSVFLLLWLQFTLVPVASGHNCAQTIQGLTDPRNVPQSLIEDCMRTGYAQAILTALVGAVAGGAIARRAGQALSEAAQQTEKEKEEEEEKKKHRTNYFRLRVHRGGDVGGAMGVGFFTVIIEEWDGQQWGRARYLTYKGVALPYLGTRASVTSASSDWKEFTTAEPMTAGEFAGAGSVTYWPGISIGSWGANAGVTLNFATHTGKKVQVSVESSGAGLGVTALSHFWIGYWTVK
jgi:hypothetical protein